MALDGGVFSSLGNFVVSNAVSLLSIVVGGLLAAFFYVRSRRLKQPSWDIKTLNLITGRTAMLPGMEIRFNGEPIQQVSVLGMSPCLGLLSN